MCQLLWIFAILTLCAKKSDAAQSPLVFLHDYETLNYDRQHVIDVATSRSRRSISSSSSEPVDLIFSSHGRTFHLQLHRDSSSAFAPDHVIDLNGKQRLFANGDLPFLYNGKLKGDPKSSVFGSIVDGVFDGQIRTGSGDVFYVEKTSKYYGDLALGLSHGVHSIIYHENEVDESKVRTRRATSDSHSQHRCGLHGETRHWMEHVQGSAANKGIPSSFGASETAHDESDDAFSKYLDPSKRERRQATNGVGKDFEKDSDGYYRVRSCSLYVRTDQKLWEQVFKHEGQRNRKRTQDEIISLIHNHIKAVNSIYENTNFGGLTGFNFVVQRITVFDNESCIGLNGDEKESNPFCEDNVDVSNYLNKNSVQDHGAFCLAYALTFRDFDGGTLGLAWVASASSAVRGGICEPFQSYTEGSAQVRRSLNTGIITLVNYNNRVPPKVSQLTLAHEIGHNFGSPHDFPSQCVPGLPDGNYIMFASATSGDKPNNARFSSCSIANISQVLKAVLSQKPADGNGVPLNAYGQKRNCFTARKGPFCGNLLVEEGEECDCGFEQSECDAKGDSCCHPRSPDPRVGCTLKRGKACSPSQGPCCTGSCEYSPQSSTCRPDGECTLAQQCTGSSAVCFDSPPKSGQTVCGDNTKLCHAGACNASICLVVNMEECFLTEGDNQRKCQLACMRRGGDPKTDCRSSFELPQLRDWYQPKTALNNVPQGILLKPGSPCDNFLGYCDVFHKCRSVDSNGPLSRLKDLFSPAALESVSQWVQHYWWAVVLMGIGVVLFMALFIKCCAVHTPSSNPRKPPAQSIYETLRHPTTLMRSQARRAREQGQPGQRQASAGANNAPARGRRRSRQNRSADANDARGASLDPPLVNNGHSASAPTFPVAAPMPYPDQPPPYSAVVVEPVGARMVYSVPGGSALATPAAAASGPPRGYRKRKKKAASGGDASRERAANMEMRTRRQ